MKLRACFFTLGASCILAFSAVAQEPIELSVPPDVETVGAAASVDHLVDLMEERLSLMHDVARWKWNYGCSVEDLEREQQILKILVQRAVAYGVDKSFAQEFVQAQMDAAKAIQSADMAQWEAEGAGYFEGVIDLKGRIRPQLISLTYQVLSELAQLDLEDPDTISLFDERINEVIQRAEFAPEVYDLAFEPLRSAG